MGKIIYRPHCAKCGALINEKVSYTRLKTIIGNSYLYHGDLIEIEPNRCESCGEVFETIEVPIPEESENWVNFAEDLIPIMNEAESEEYCDRNIRLRNEYNRMICDECEITVRTGDD